MEDNSVMQTAFTAIRCEWA